MLRRCRCGSHVALALGVGVSEDGGRAGGLGRVIDGRRVLGGQAVSDAAFGHGADGTAWIDGRGGVGGGRGAALGWGGRPGVGRGCCWGEVSGLVPLDGHACMRRLLGGGWGDIWIGSGLWGKADVSSRWGEITLRQGDTSTDSL